MPKTLILRHFGKIFEIICGFLTTGILHSPSLFIGTVIEFQPTFIFPALQSIS